MVARIAGPLEEPGRSLGTSHESGALLARMRSSLDLFAEGNRLSPTDVARILLVDDDLDLVDLTAYSLRKEGYEVTIVSEGHCALRSLRGDQPDLVLLDMRLPDSSGVTVCREMREHSSVPIIMVSGASDEEPIISSFAAGADDFVIKPYSHRQLAARIHALLGRGSVRSQVEPRRELYFGEMELDPQSHELRRANEMVLLTPIECRLLQMLVLNRGHVVSSERLIEFAWRYEGADSRSLRTHVSHLRQKMRATKGELGYITAISRVGYSLTDQ
jgi:DNA-binding response OmpR family regulator